MNTDRLPSLQMPEQPRPHVIVTHGHTHTHTQSHTQSHTHTWFVHTCSVSSTDVIAAWIESLSLRTAQAKRK